MLDAAQEVELAFAHGRAPVHRGLDGRIDPDELSRRLEPAEEIVDVARVGRGLEAERHAFDERRDEVERLLPLAVE